VKKVKKLVEIAEEVGKGWFGVLAALISVTGIPFYCCFDFPFLE
jgi:hypothetical protein